MVTHVRHGTAGRKERPSWSTTQSAILLSVQQRLGSSHRCWIRNPGKFLLKRCLKGGTCALLTTSSAASILQVCEDMLMQCHEHFFKQPSELPKSQACTIVGKHFYRAPPAKHQYCSHKGYIVCAYTPAFISRFIACLQMKSQSPFWSLLCCTCSRACT